MHYEVLTMDAAKNRALVEQKTETVKPAKERLPRNIQNHILSFLGNKIGIRDFKASSCSYQTKDKKDLTTTLFSNVNVLYNDQFTAQIAHNLLWHINVEETLALAAQNPESLLNVVEIEDPYGQRVRGTPLQIVAAAGDRNTREMKAEEKNYGLVERLRPCFKNQNDFDNQLAAWFGPGSKEATQKTMAPYVAAIKTLCQEIIESKDISNAIPFEALLDLPIAEKFRKALAPNPKHVVTSGFLFDMQIFLDFFAIFEANVNNDKIEDKARPNLDGWWSPKSDLLDAIVYPALQGRSQRCDIGIFKKGVGNVADGQIPDMLDYSKGAPDSLAGLGKSHFFGFYGNKYPLARRTRRSAFSSLHPALSKLVSSKNISCGIMQHQQNHKPTRCVIM